MKSINASNILIEGYLKLLQSLKPNEKLEIIARLSKSMQIKSEEEKNSIRKFYGALQTPETADELIHELRQSRSFTRKIADL